VPQLALVLVAGLAGALFADLIGTPIPFLLGSLAGSAALSLTVFAQTGRRLWYPELLRRVFIGVIGTMIGTTFSPELLSKLPDLAISLAAMVGFIVLAQSTGFGIFRFVGGYDRKTAFYAAMPGGLIEAVSLGEKAGADVEILSLQHFARIILVVLIVPTLFYLWTGQTVGSSAGQSLQLADTRFVDWALFVVLVPAGLYLGKLAHLPASFLMGPLLLTAGLHAGSVVHINGPESLLSAAQLIVGAGLGTRFARSTLWRLLSGFGLGLLSVGTMLMIGIGIAMLLAPIVPMSFEALVISFAPGGVTEMGLIALSLGVSPVLVIAHHLFRIVFTVSAVGMLTRNR
jgi:membrane AbrB-like protein